MIEFREKKPCFDIYLGDTFQLIPENRYLIKTRSPDTISSIEIVDVFNNVFELVKDVDYWIEMIANTYVLVLNTAFDLDRRVYLKLVDEDSIFYSEIIKISSHDQELTTRIDYKCEDENILYSCQIPMYFRNEDSEVELETYKEISRNITVSYISSLSMFSVYLCDHLNIDIYNRLIKLFYDKEVYFDYELVNIYAPPEKEELQGWNDGTSINIKVSKLGVNIKPKYFIVSEDSTDVEVDGYLCNRDEVVDSLLRKFYFTGGKFYQEFIGEVERYILDDNGLMFTKYEIDYNAPPDLFTRTTNIISGNSRIVTEDNIKIITE